MPWKENDVVTLREEFVLKALGGSVSFHHLCMEYGISRKTGYKWLTRFRQSGLGGLKDQTRCPRSSPAAMSEGMVCDLIRIKLSSPASWGPKKVLGVYQRRHGGAPTPSLSSVKRVLDKTGFVAHRRRSRRPEMGRVQEGLVAQKPNELWTVDFKGWWKTRDGARCEPLTVRDSYSRFLLDMRVLERSAEEVVRPAFESMFETYGLPEVIRSDNGSPFASSQAPLGLSRLSSWWVTLGIRLDRIAPGRPDQNGAHERIHRDIRSELQGCPADGVEESQSLFDEWRRTFNWERPHEALGMKTPGEIYRASERAYTPGPVSIAYPPNWMERMVGGNGNITLCSVQVYVTQALAGYAIGLQPVKDQLDVWFDYLRLGHIDLHVMKYIPVTEPVRRHSSSGRLAARRREVPSPIKLDNQARKVLPMS